MPKLAGTPPADAKPQGECVPSKAPPAPLKKTPQGGILAGFERDDLILAAILLVLVLDGCNDKLLLAAIGFLLLEGF